MGKEFGIRALMEEQLGKKTIRGCQVETLIALPARPV